MRISLYDYCLKHDKLTLLQQWHSSKNDQLTPWSVTYGSKRKVWWRCEQGHEWQTAVYTRTGGAGCPYCAGKMVLPGANDLASQRPDVAAQWHPTKNGSLTAEQVLAGCHRSIWWVCEKGHEWRAIVKSRANGCGCPVCADKVVLTGENDLASTDPTLAKQWHPTKNGKLTPRDIVAGTRRKVWWRCSKGHEWQASIASRSSGVGCPVCAGKVVLTGENDLASVFPAIAAQWLTEKNGALTAGSVSPYSNRKVWWRCELGHEYQSIVASRTMSGKGCPYCAGKKVLSGFNDLATIEPRVAAQWHPTLNGQLTPDMVTVGSSKSAWWQCAEGHVWKAIIYSRTGAKKCGCPVCAGKVRLDRSARYLTVPPRQDINRGADRV